MEQLDDDIWVKPAPLRLIGLHLGTRMTVVRLPSGRLWIHSPVQLEPVDVEALRAAGSVDSIVAPNLYHHLFVGQLQQVFSEAKVYAPRRLRRKRPDLRIDIDLDDGQPPEWSGVLEPVHIAGTLLNETAFVHRPTQTLITADLLENFTTCGHGFTRLYLRLAGLHGKPGFSRFLRPVVRDRRRARTAIDNVLRRDFDRVILAHGEVMASGGRDAIRDAYQWL